MSAALWKGIAIALLALLLAVGGSTGAGWWLAAHDRDQARADFKAEQDVTADLRTGIREQNRAVEVMAKAKETADARGESARQVAAANGKRLDTVLSQIAAARANTCTDAMPAVNLLLEGVRR